MADDLGTILVNQHVPRDVATDLRDDFSEAGLPFDLVEKESPLAYNFVEIIIPTAIIVALTTAYASKILEKIAEDNYDFAKKLWNRLLRKPPFSFEVRKADGSIVEPTFSREISIIYDLSDGLKLTLLFRKGATEREARESLRRSHELVSLVCASAANLASFRKTCEGMMGFFGQAYVYFDGNTLRMLDWVETSRLGCLQSIPLSA